MRLFRTICVKEVDLVAWRVVAADVARILNSWRLLSHSFVSYIIRSGCSVLNTLYPMLGPSVTFALIALILITRCVSPASTFVSCMTKPCCPISIRLCHSTCYSSSFWWKFGTSLSRLSNCFAEMTGWLVEISCSCIEISAVIWVTIVLTRRVIRSKHIGVWFLSFLLPIASCLEECNWISLVQHVMGDWCRASS